MKVLVPLPGILPGGAGFMLLVAGQGLVSMAMVSRVLRALAGERAENVLAPASMPSRSSRGGWRVSALIAGISLSLLASGSASASPMILQGQFEVDHMGAATYHLPLAVPPGTAGMEPALSFDYSSGNGNGLLGVGWSLGGLLVMTRCEQTMVEDGAPGRIGYDANDRFCLEGERLMLVNGTYGADGSEYRTEIDGFNKIIAHGAAGSGPAWFEIHTKAGQTFELGNTTDSRILALGTPTARLWAINKITDTVNNYLTVSYTNDTTNGQYYPTRIDYTGNTAQGLSPYASVQFTYVDRPATDQIPLYSAGSMVKLTKELTHVKTFVGTTQAMDYGITYQQSRTSSHLLATTMTACGADGTCLEPLVTAWDEKAVPFYYDRALSNILPAAAPGTVSTTVPLLTDATNVGRMNAIFFNNNGTMLSVSKFDSVTLPGTYPQSDAVTYKFTKPVNIVAGRAPQIVDLQGDGLADLVYEDANTTTPHLILGGGADYKSAVTLFNLPKVTTPFGDDYAPDFSDLNGDGKSDIIYHDATTALPKFYYAFGTGDTSAANLAFPTPVNINLFSTITPTPAWQSIKVGTAQTELANITGRGAVDLVIAWQSSDNNYHVGYLSWSGSGYSTIVPLLTSAGAVVGGTAKYTVDIADVNGDGLSDLLLTTASSQALYISNGNGFNAPTVPTTVLYNACPNGLEFIDMYHTGRTDAVCHTATAIRVAQSTGTNFGALTTIKTYTSGYGAYLSDVNGDGLPDFIQETTGNVYSVTLAETCTVATLPCSNDIDLANSIDRQSFMGTGRNLKFFYYSLSHDTTAPIDASTSILDNGDPGTSAAEYDITTKVYYKGTGAVYPKVNVQTPLYVVRQVQNKAANTQSIVSYRYADLQLDQLGRGFLGFQQTRQTEQYTHMSALTTYYQDFPYTGMVQSEVKTTGLAAGNTTTNWPKLAETTNVVASKTMGSGASAHYFPYISQRVESKWDLDGSAILPVTSTFSYDNYGNATQLVTSTSDGYSTTTNNTYTNDETKWFLGRLTRSTVTNVTP